MQVGVLFSSDSIMPKAERIDPIQGLKRLFSIRSLVELLKSLMKIGVIGYICYYTLRTSDSGIGHSVGSGGQRCFLLSGRCRVSDRVAGGFRFAGHCGPRLCVSALRVRKVDQDDPEEFKREMREMEGDPMIRARVRSIQREMAQRRMMEAVPEAEVVVTNPTEYAVALKYESGSMAAPVVVAKGRRLVAQKIRELAERHGVPIVEDPPLARALYKQVEIGRTIPETLYRAVAEILAYVYRLQKKRKADGGLDGLKILISREKHESSAPGGTIRASRNLADIGAAVMIIGILTIMIAGLQTWLMSTLLALNICFSLIILLISFYILRPLDFSTFPSILLIATVFRLSLNVASTKLILSRYAGDPTEKAGAVINFFGRVVAADPIVGLVIFAILVIIQFVVITKGAGRIAEVAARFTLDAMPGKQMAIDADLNAGLIDENDARARRQEIMQEADFYGAWTAPASSCAATPLPAS
jgi:type III secretory pathway component EscU